MAVLWQSSLVPFIDPNGDPYSGAQAFFYASGTTTPLTVYQDSALGIAHDSPVVANASGVFPAVFLPATQYRIRIEDDDGNVIPGMDVDGIDPPQAASFVAPSAGDTDPSLLFTTGMVIDLHGTTVPSGWVRCNGRTLGSAASGATERANDDTEDLFEYLWSADSTLTVSAGRGATAAGDFAANKTIALPDYRSRARIGRGSMGSSAAGLIADALTDGPETADTLGATVGASTHTLSTAEIPSHTHTATVTDPGHHHAVDVNVTGAGGGGGALLGSGSTVNTEAASTGVSVTNASVGGGSSHLNMQPSVAVTTLIKL